MKKIETSIDTLKKDIKEFYDYKKWHFLTLNGVALEDDMLEIQWIFSEYEVKNKIVVYYAHIKYDELIPSIVEIIPSAIISQREIVDMFGVEVEGSQKGLYLDEDSQQKPLSGCSI
ncbi:MAG: NADH-quinone oxidoreductase subunit C [Sulfurimonas sp.]|uniref:NADH-quinone oxidoreductase subunit C n=1 Tax=Sulfurimonas sp. TaxID=2022749 RepID=UPI002605CC0E|nr:NADH-quinone oxidoreductase subunit C [Sulfurimonas sp.]MCW8894338.1 NADH-quinone oxidoreductase subunit C [Sulfurimonas sp.]MCW8954241.1 NADH-quinone oxidoreductase subunit C [Sulfurimonas sp.]